MEVYKYHSNITQKRHGASRNYRYVLDISAPMLKVALEDPSSSTGICLVSVLSWVNNCFFLACAAPLGPGVPESASRVDAAVLKASLSTRRASPVSPCTVRTPLLAGIFMRLYAGCVAAMNWASAG